MKKALLFLSLVCLQVLSAQEVTKGTIKVKKKDRVQSVFFDNVNNRLIGKDIYGNILDSAVVAFDVMVTIKGIAYEESVNGTTLSPTLQYRLGRVDGNSTLFFTNIKVKEKSGTYLDWPKIIVKTGNAYEQREE